MVQIGALLNIDPGQSRDKIARSFDTMRTCGFRSCRMIVDPAYGDGIFDLYDCAFGCASERDMDIVVTLRGEEEVCIRAVSRYRGRRNLKAWDLTEGQGSRPGARTDRQGGDPASGHRLRRI